MNKKIVIIATIVLIVDQIIKSIIQVYNVHVTLLKGFFSLNYYQNTGAAWSILEGKQVLLIGISLLMLVLVYNMTFSYKESKATNIMFGLLFGGIIGNLTDRIFYGFVRDFIDIEIFGYAYPVFNIADMAIVIGVILILHQTIKGELKDGSKSRRRKQSKN